MHGGGCHFARFSLALKSSVCMVLQINGPFTPDLAHSLSEFGEALKTNKWPHRAQGWPHWLLHQLQLPRDMQRAASVARQALAAGHQGQGIVWLVLQSFS